MWVMCSECGTSSLDWLHFILLQCICSLIALSLHAHLYLLVWCRRSLPSRAPPTTMLNLFWPLCSLSGGGGGVASTLTHIYDFFVLLCALGCVSLFSLQHPPVVRQMLFNFLITVSFQRSQSFLYTGRVLLLVERFALCGVCPSLLHLILYDTHPHTAQQNPIIDLCLRRLVYIGKHCWQKITKGVWIVVGKSW